MARIISHTLNVRNENSRELDIIKLQMTTQYLESLACGSSRTLSSLSGPAGPRTRARADVGEYITAQDAFKERSLFADVMMTTV